MRLLLLFFLFAAGCQNPALTSAKLYLQDEDLTRAKQQLEKALAESPNDPEVHFLIGRISARQGAYATMDSAFSSSLSLSSHFAEEIEQMRRQYWAREYNTGVGLATSGAPNYRAALHAFGNAVVIDPVPLEPWHSIARLYHHLDSLATAVEIYIHILFSIPTDTTSLAGLGAIYLEQQRYIEAVDPLSLLVEFATEDVNAHINLGIAYEHTERYSEAETRYLEAIELDPRNGLAHYNLGNLRWNRAEYATAADAYRRVLVLSPEDDDARYNLAVTYVHLGDLDKALPLLQTLSQRMPDNAAIWRQLGRIYAAKGMKGDSRRALERAEAASLKEKAEAASIEEGR